MLLKTAKVAPVKPAISIDLLNKIDVRVGTIELVEDIPSSEKLVRLTVDFGDHKRRILAGMKRERSNPKEVQGKQALFVVNLEPKRITGEVSEAMLFDIGYADGIKPVLAVPERPVPNGARAADHSNIAKACGGHLRRLRPRNATNTQTILIGNTCMALGCLNQNGQSALLGKRGQDLLP